MLTGTILALLASAPAGAPFNAQTTSQETRSSWAVYADRIHVAPGQTIEGGTVVVRDGKIASVTKGEPPRDSDEVLRAAAITAGMVDLSARVTTGLTSVEQSREVTAEVRVGPSLNLFDTDWDREARSGVTTVLINPPDENVIGGLGIALKTHGEPDLGARTLKADAALRGAMGSQPSRRNHPAFQRPDDFYSRRPTTRMGVEWVLRKAFYDAGYAQGKPERAFPGSAELQSVLAGQRPFFVQAWTTQDIRTTVYLKEEMEREGFGSMNLVVDAAAEAWREPELLVRSKTGVVLPPFPWQGRTSEGALMPFNTARVLLDAGLRVALSSHGAASADQRLDRQAGFAMRGGLTFDEALAAVTVTPAEMIGVADRIGTLEAGKDGDCVLWSGTPFETGSRVIGVLVDGRLALDPRPARTE